MNCAVVDYDNDVDDVAVVDDCGGDDAAFQTFHRYSCDSHTILKISWRQFGQSVQPEA